MCNIKKLCLYNYLTSCFGKNECFTWIHQTFNFICKWLAQLVKPRHKFAWYEFIASFNGVDNDEVLFFTVCISIYITVVLPFKKILPHKTRRKISLNFYERIKIKTKNKYFCNPLYWMNGNPYKMAANFKFTHRSIT